MNFEETKIKQRQNNKNHHKYTQKPHKTQKLLKNKRKK